MDKELADYLLEFSKIYEDGLREHLKIPSDWTYFSQTFARSLYDDLMNIIGDAEYVFVSGSVDKYWARMSVFLSPLAMERINEYNTRQIEVR